MNEPEPLIEETPTAPDMALLRPLSTIRIPLLIVVLVALAGQPATGIPALNALAVAAVIGGALTMAIERRLIIELLQWKRLSVLLSPLLAAGFLAIVHTVLHVLTAQSMNTDTGINPLHPPLVFRLLIELRTALETGVSPWLGLASAAVAAVGMELFFRGFVMTRLMVHWSHWQAALIAAVLSALATYLSLGVLAGIAALSGGVVAGALMLKSRSLIPAILFHLCVLVSAFLFIVFPDVRISL
jgi:membrane protease YdiL (CAAX protease family)